MRAGDERPRQRWFNYLRPFPRFLHELEGRTHVTSRELGLNAMSTSYTLYDTSFL